MNYIPDRPPATDDWRLELIYDEMVSRGLKWKVDTQEWQCPILGVDDHTPSCGIKVGEKNIILFNCFASCEGGYEEHLKALDLKPSDLVTKTPYVYRDHDGKPVYVRTRTDGDPSGKKSFDGTLPLNPDGTRRRYDPKQGGAMHGVPIYLWDTPEVDECVEAGIPIVLVEGEKAAVYCNENAGLDFWFTTMTGPNWIPEYGATLQKAVKVWIAADLDRSGYKRAIAALDGLKGCGVAAGVVTSATGKPKHGLDDHFLAGLGWDDVIHLTEAQLRARLNDAEDAEYDSEVGEKLRRLRIDRDARRMLAGEDFVEPPERGSLTEQLLVPPPPTEFIVGQALIPRYGTIQINAQAKAGKTTFAVNLVLDLANKGLFLDTYPTRFAEGSITYWNMEVAEGTLDSWLGARKMPSSATDRIFIDHLVGRGVDVLDPNWYDWTVRKLKERNTKIWVLDPIGDLLADENLNSFINQWWRQIQKIKLEAGVDLVILIHHTGHAGLGQEDALPRSRGASAMIGKPDVVYTYRHDGALGEMPKTDSRYLGGFGRDVDIHPEIAMKFNEVTKQLYVDSDSRGRSADQIRTQAVRLASVLWAKPFGEKMNAGELDLAAGSMKSASKSTARQEAVELGYLVAEKNGKETIYSRGEINPVAEKIAYKKENENVVKVGRGA